MCLKTWNTWFYTDIWKCVEMECLRDNIHDSHARGLGLNSPKTHVCCHSPIYMADVGRGLHLNFMYCNNHLKSINHSMILWSSGMMIDIIWISEANEKSSNNVKDKVVIKWPSTDIADIMTENQLKKTWVKLRYLEWAQLLMVSDKLIKSIKKHHNPSTHQLGHYLPNKVCNRTSLVYLCHHCLRKVFSICDIC